MGGAATVAAMAVAAAMALIRLAAPAGTVRSEAAADEGAAAEAEEDSIPISSSSNIRRAPFSLSIGLNCFISPVYLCARHFGVQHPARTIAAQLLPSARRGRSFCFIPSVDTH